MEATESKFQGVKTSREFAKLLVKFKPKTEVDVHDIIGSELQDELHYFLAYKTDNSNVNMDTYIYLDFYVDLVDDIVDYLNLDL